MANRKAHVCPNVNKPFSILEINDEPTSRRKETRGNSASFTYDLVAPAVVANISSSYRKLARRNRGSVPSTLYAVTKRFGCSTIELRNDPLAFRKLHSSCFLRTIGTSSHGTACTHCGALQCFFFNNTSARQPRPTRHRS